MRAYPLGPELGKTKTIRQSLKENERGPNEKIGVTGFEVFYIIVSVFGLVSGFRLIFGGLISPLWVYVFILFDIILVEGYTRIKKKLLRSKTISI